MSQAGHLRVTTCFSITRDCGLSRLGPSSHVLPRGQPGVCLAFTLCWQKQRGLWEDLCSPFSPGVVAQHLYGAHLELGHAQRAPGAWPGGVRPELGRSEVGDRMGPAWRQTWPGGGGLVAQLCLTLAVPRTAARQAPPSMGVSRQEYWSGLPFPPPGDLPTQGWNPRLLHCSLILYCGASREATGISPREMQTAPGLEASECERGFSRGCRWSPGRLVLEMRDKLRKGPQGLGEGGAAPVDGEVSGGGQRGLSG